MTACIYPTHAHNLKKTHYKPTSQPINPTISPIKYLNVYARHTHTHNIQTNDKPKSLPTYRTTSPILHPYTEPLLYPHHI